MGIVSSYAQSFTLKGTVVDERGEPCIGVSVIVKGTTIGTATDIDGKFQITVDDLKSKNSIVFSYIGMKSQEYIVDGKTNDITIVLEEDTAVLDEVVVMGYESVTKASIAGAIVTSSDFSGIKSGTLTAGEVNDFAKWDLWEQILTNDFKNHLNTWKYRPLERYTAQLTNRQGMPVSNADVRLQDDFGTVLWKSKTDNTGKAELWTDLFVLEKTTNTNLKLVFEYEGIETEIVQVTPFSQGINTASIDTDCHPRNKVDLFFIVDATGSMSDEIRYLQVELSDIMQKVKKQQSDLQLRIGSLVYRDHGDEYLTRKSSLDADVDKTIDFIKAQYADGGGDYPEAVDEALLESIENEDWDNEALARIAFLVLDAPSHTDPKVIEQIANQMRLASEKGIRIVPIACSDIQKDGEYLMRVLALATNGTYLFLTDDSGIGNTHIKPTTDKYDVEKLNDAIVRIISQYTQMPDCSDEKWIKEYKKASDSDKFVPNPYDEDLEKNVSKLLVKDIMKVYPNPCRDILKVDINKENVQDVFFVDMTGKSLFRFSAKKNETLEINVRNLSSGIYFVKAFYKGKWFAEKVIVH